MTMHSEVVQWSSVVRSVHALIGTDGARIDPPASNRPLVHPSTQKHVMRLGPQNCILRSSAAFQECPQTVTEVARKKTPVILLKVQVAVRLQLNTHAP